MIEKIIRFSVYHRAVVLFATAAFIVAGWLGFQSLAIDVMPDITNIQVAVNTQVEGFAPAETERYITVPIETAMHGIAGVSSVRSLTKFGLSQVTVVFEDGTDIYRARQQVSERLQALGQDLPSGVQPRLGPVTTGLGEIYFYTIEAKSVAQGEERVRQLTELRSIQDWDLRPRLLTVKGVAGVDSTGGYEKQFQVQPKAAEMKRYGLSFEDLAKVLEATNRNVGGGYIQRNDEQFLVQGVGLFQGLEDLRKVPVKALENFQTVSLGDVAEVREGAQLRVGAALVNGKEAVLGMVYLLSGDNSRRVAQEVDRKLQELRKNLPEGYVIETLYDRSELVNATLRTVTHNLTVGAGLVIVVLLLLVGNIRAALITALMIPLALLFTFLMMNWRGISGNLMSLGALDFGIIVDGAVIVLENCVRKIQERGKALGRSLSREEVQATVFAATTETRRAAGFGELIIVVVFIPIFALTGVEGKMFKPMAAAFSFAILGALIFSFTTAPALAGLVLSGRSGEKEPWLMRALSWAYRPVLDFSLRARPWVIGLAVLAIALGGLLFTRLGAEFVPQLNEGSIVLMLHREPNISMDASVRMQEKSERILAEFPEVKRVYSRIGTAEIATDPMGMYLSDTFVVLKDPREWPRVEDKKTTKDAIAQKLASTLKSEIPEQEVIVTQPIQMRFNELLEGTRADVALKIYSDDLPGLLEKSEQAEAVLKKIPGAGDVEAELSDTSPILQILPKEGVLAQYGLSKGLVLDAISSALAGHPAGVLFEGIRRTPIVVRLAEGERSNLDSLRALPVSVAPYLSIQLKDLADLEFSQGFGTILRENGKRRTAILINPRGRDTESFVNEARSAVENQIPLSSGEFFEWGGNFRNLQQARDRLLVLIPMVLSLVFLMIFMLFGDFLKTCIIFLGIPFALVGGVIAMGLKGLPFSISAGIGFIALSGIAVLNGVVLVSYFQQLEAEGLGSREAARRGALLRLRPVMMTALVEVFGFFPMMLSNGIGAEVQKPLATVVIGGVLSSTLLTLVILPALYSYLPSRRAERESTF